jgi:excisionase family DNA binding protein
MNQPIELHSESLWTADDVAAYLKVSRSWVYHRAESGKLPHVRVGGLLRFQPNEIRAHVETSSAEPVRAKTLSSSRPALRNYHRG